MDLAILPPGLLSLGITAYTVGHYDPSYAAQESLDQHTGSEGGAENAAILFSVVVSCKLAGVDPFAYLRDVLMRIHTHPADSAEELTPREWHKRFGAHASRQAQPAA